MSQTTDMMKTLFSSVTSFMKSYLTGKGFIKFGVFIKGKVALIKLMPEMKDIIIA